MSKASVFTCSLCSVFPVGMMVGCCFFSETRGFCVERNLSAPHPQPRSLGLAFFFLLHLVDDFKFGFREHVCCCVSSRHPGQLTSS